MADSGDKSNLKQRLMFWKSSQEKATPAMAVGRLRSLQEMLEKKSDWLEAKIDNETKTAIENRVKNKRAALQALRRRKRWEKQLTNIDGTMSSVEMQLDAITNATMTTEVVNCLQQSRSVMQSVHGNLTPDKVADLRDDIEEMIDDNQQIHDLLAQPLGAQDFDEDDLMAELGELEAEELSDNLCDLHLDLPPVPGHKVEDKPKEKRKTKEEMEEEEDLRKLVAEFS